MIGSVFRDIEPGGVRLIRCADVADAVARLLAWGERETEHLRVVACHWPELPGAEAVLDQVLSALARTALALWPNWYGARCGAGAEREAGGTKAAAPAPPGLSAPRAIPAWHDAAAAMCHEGKPPRPPGFAHAVQAAQLALAIEPRRLWLALASAVVEPQADRLLGLAAQPNGWPRKLKRA